MDTKKYYNDYNTEYLLESQKIIAEILQERYLKEKFEKNLKARNKPSSSVKKGEF